MIVDILSDLHLDFYFKPHLTTLENVSSFFEPIFTNNTARTIGDVLIIARDIGHYNAQNIEVLKILQKKFYKHIICVLGNHDYYLVNGEARYSFENNSFKRIENLRKLINKEKNIYQKCNVMITHVNPSFDEKHIDKKYHNNQTNTFFTFNGSKFYRDGTMKYWVFGHTHDSIEYEINDVKFLCNPLGYPNESGYGENIKMKCFEI